MYRAAGILLHGYHLEAPAWERVVWGEPPHRLGRVPKALLAFQAFGGRVIAVGSGACADARGRPESEVTIARLRDGLPDLKRFEAFAGIDVAELWDRVEPALVPNLMARNTRDEVEQAASLFSGLACDAMVVVSSAFHAPRCLRDAAVVLERRGLRRLSNHLYAAAADTAPPSGVPADVAIVEPPHRPDACALDLPGAVNRLLAMPPEARARCLDVIAEQATPEG